MSSSFESEQQKTNPYEYHQVIALSANLINKSLKQMYDNAKETSPLKRYTFKKRDENVTLHTDAPRVSIAIDDKHNRHIYYHMNVLDGNAKVFESDESEEIIEVSLDGAELVFPVTIESEILQRGNPDHNKWATSTGFIDEAFSLSRLYLQFTRIATTFDEDRSVLPAQLKDNPAAAGTFAFLIGQHGKTMTHKRTNFVGLQIQPKDPSAKTAREKMVPTSMEYVAYPWKEGERTAPQSSKRHCLCILSMTDFADPPQTPQLKYSGPFTDSGATLCLNRELLWTNWLLEDSKALLQALHIVPLQPYLGPPTIPNCVVHCYPQFAIGSSEPVSSYKWTESGKGWSWEAPLKSEIVRGTYCDRQWTATDAASSRITIDFTAGGSKVMLTGDLMKNFHLLEERSGQSIIDDSVIEAKWTAEFTLFPCQSGTIGVSRATHDVQLLPLQATGQEWWTTRNGTPEAKPFGVFQSELRGEFGMAVEKKLGELTNNIQRRLEDQHRLFLPGGGAFNVGDVKFNARGDLLVSLDYHDFEPPEGPDPASTHPGISLKAINQMQQERSTADNKFFITQNACGDPIPPAWQVVHRDQQYRTLRDPLRPDHELQHEVGKVVSSEIAVRG